MPVIIPIAQVVGAVAGVAAAGASIAQGEKASRQAKRVGRAQSAALRAEAGAERERGRRLSASQRAAFGAAGVTAAGSPLIVQAASLLDSVRTRERILAGSRNAQSNADAQAEAFRIQGIAGALGGLSQAASFASDPRFPSFTGATDSP